MGDKGIPTGERKAYLSRLKVLDWSRRNEDGTRVLSLSAREWSLYALVVCYYLTAQSWEWMREGLG